MRYSGSKRRFMNELRPILMEHIKENTLFIDAFGGGRVVFDRGRHMGRGYRAGIQETDRIGPGVDPEGDFRRIRQMRSFVDTLFRDFR